MILLCVETSLSHLTEISSVELVIGLNFSFFSDSIDSFCDRTVKWDFYSSWTWKFWVFDRVNETLYDL